MKTGEQGFEMVMSPSAFVYLSAQNSGGSGTITCVIESDGVVIETATSVGAYKIASCSGKVPYE